MPLTTSRPLPLKGHLIMAYDQALADAEALVAKLTEERDEAYAALDLKHRIMKKHQIRAVAAERELESVRVLLWPDGGARTVPMDRRDGFAAAVTWLLRQRVALTMSLDQAERERDGMRDVLAAAVAWKAAWDHDGGGTGEYPDVHGPEADLNDAIVAYTEGTKP